MKKYVINLKRRPDRLQNFKNNILKMLSSEGVLVNGDFKVIAFNKI